MSLGLAQDFGYAHGAAITLLFVLWFGYSFFLRRFYKGSLNDQLYSIRARWIVGALRRSSGPFDAILLGHIVNSITFFGSATMLVLAATATLVTSAGATHATVSQFYAHGAPSFGLYVLLLLVLNVTLAVSFFAFIYALRKLIYVIALVGALPDAPATPELLLQHDKMAEAASAVLSSALSTFNFGIRGYYYFIAAMGLFVSPWVSIALMIGFSVMLVFRQVGSQAAKNIGAYVEASDAYVGIERKLASKGG